MKEENWINAVKNIKMPQGTAEKVINNYISNRKGNSHVFDFNKVAFASIAAAFLVAILSSVTYVSVYASYVEKGITVFFDEGINAKEISDIEEQIKDMPDVDSITYVSGDEAWESFKEKYLDEKTANVFAENPLANSSNYIIKVKRSVSLEKLENQIMEIDGVRKINETEERTVPTYNGNK